MLLYKPKHHSKNTLA